jgi:hypothetical protein
MRLRPATVEDIPEIERVMRESIRGTSVRTYDSRQVEGSLRFVAHLDRELVRDSTYFVVEENDEIAGCRGTAGRR